MEHCRGTPVPKPKLLFWSQSTFSVQAHYYKWVPTIHTVCSKEMDQWNMSIRWQESFVTLVTHHVRLCCPTYISPRHWDTNTCLTQFLSIYKAGFSEVCMKPYKKYWLYCQWNSKNVGSPWHYYQWYNILNSLNQSYMQLYVINIQLVL